MDIQQILSGAVKSKAADIFLVAGLPLSYKINGQIRHQNEEKLTPAQTNELILAIYGLSKGHSPNHLLEHGDDDFSFSLPGLSRFRVSTYKQRGSLAAVIRVVNFELPDYKDLGIPDNVMRIAGMTKGFVLVTGPAGSGKSGMSTSSHWRTPSNTCTATKRAW